MGNFLPRATGNGEWRQESVIAGWPERNAVVSTLNCNACCNNYDRKLHGIVTMKKKTMRMFSVSLFYI